MQTASAVFSLEKAKAYRPIFGGGLIAGALDIAAAFINGGLRGVSPMRVLQAIASGLLGPRAFTGGFVIAALGLLLHFFIATVATAVYYVISRKFKLLVQQVYVYGPIYGVAVYLFMNFIVLPLSEVPFKTPHTFSVIATGVIILIFCIGLPIALTVRRFSK